MEEKTTPAAPAPAQSAPAPAMDVVAPHTPQPLAAEPGEKDEKPADSAKSTPAEASKDKVQNQSKKPETKTPRNGVGMAIFATMVIVLGLAAMATYAYLQT